MYVYTDPIINELEFNKRERRHNHASPEGNRFNKIKEFSIDTLYICLYRSFANYIPELQ